MAERIKRSSKFAILLSVILILLLPSCKPPQNQSGPSSSDNKVGAPPIGVTPPPPLETDRGNPKLEYVLVQLIQAEKQGQAESFALQRGIQLQDGKVLVTIYVMPGQAEMAAKTAISAGAELASSYSSQKLFDAWVPIASLDALANDSSTSSIIGTSPAQLNR